MAADLSLLVLNETQNEIDMSKVFRSLALSYLLLCACNAAWSDDRRPGSADDHLIPMNGRIDAPYEKLLNRKLFITPANYTRIVVLSSPASIGELAVSIYSKGNNADEVGITITRAERNLWAAEFGGDPSFPKVPAVNVARCDALLPKMTATVVSGAIKRMVDGSRPLSRSGRIILDATDIVFSVEDREGKRAEAVLTPDSHGKKSTALRQLVQLLQSYCQAKPAAKPSLSKKIDLEARNLMR
jgi:hypothetical protein